MFFLRLAHTREHVATTVMPISSRKFCARNMMHGTVKFSLFEFIRHEVGAKMGLIFNVASYTFLFQPVPATI